MILMDLHVVAVCRGAAPGAETPSGLHMFHSRDSGSAVRGAHSHPEIVSLTTEHTQKHTHSESSLPLCCKMTHVFLVCIPFRVILFLFSVLWLTLSSTSPPSSTSLPPPHRCSHDSTRVYFCLCQNNTLYISVILLDFSS